MAVVQADDTIRYDRGMDSGESGPPAQAIGAVHQAVAAFTRQVGEASQQLVKAAERFVAESMRLIDEAARRSEESTRQTGEAAQSAGAAAAEARELAAALREMLQQVTRQFEESAGAGRNSATEAAQAAEEARQAAIEAASALAMARAAVHEAEALRDEAAAAEYAALEALQAAAETSATRIKPTTSESIEDLAGELVRPQETTYQAEGNATGPARAIEEAEQPAAQAPVGWEAPLPAAGREVLDRLEADYGVLSTLVGKLHDRVASLSIEPPPTAPSAQPLPRMSEAAHGQPDSSTSSPEEAAKAPSPTIGGRVLVGISPVPDFDRLLSLDGALGRMPGIGNITLADYTGEMVTFRVEIDPPRSVEEFRDSLSRSAGTAIEIVAAGEESVSLRLAG